MALLCLTTAARAAAVDAAYVWIPGVRGTVVDGRYAGWFEVSQHTLQLVPGVYDGERKLMLSNCGATVVTRLGAAGALVAPLVGTNLGDVKIESADPVTGRPFYRAVLRNAVLLQQTFGFDRGANHDVLSLRFEGVVLTTYERKSDGALSAATQGMYTCGQSP